MSQGICVLGGGNIGTYFACVAAAKGYRVQVFSSRPEMYDGILEAVDEKDSVISGRIFRVTDRIGEAVQNCSIIFVTHPAFMFPKLSEELRPYIRKGMKIGVIPGTGGAEFSFRSCIEAGAELFGLQRVPGVARLEKYGKRVRAEGKRERLHLAALRKAAAEEVAPVMEELFEIPCEVLPNYLSVTLTPSNPILHTTRLRTLFSDYRPGVVYPENPLFYGEWSLASSELLLQCDNELQEICGMIPGMDLSAVRSLKLHYESPTAEALTEKMRSIQSLHALHSPMVRVEGGWIPDFQSRYFTADFPYGLSIIESLAGILGYSAQGIQSTMDWYRSMTGDSTRMDLRKCGISSAEDICRFYNRE